MACSPNDLKLVFPNEVGNPMNHQNMVQRHFEPALRKAGLRRIRFHDLRHTYAALLIDQGEHPKYLQVQMGHSSINITMDTYGHLMKTETGMLQAGLKRPFLDEILMSRVLPAILIF